MNLASTRTKDYDTSYMLCSARLFGGFQQFVPVQDQQDLLWFSLLLPLFGSSADEKQPTLTVCYELETCCLNTQDSGFKLTRLVGKSIQHADFNLVNCDNSDLWEYISIYKNDLGKARMQVKRCFLNAILLTKNIFSIFTEPIG